MRFDGTRWHLLPSPLIPQQHHIYLTGVSCVVARFLPDGWCQAVGWYQADGSWRPSAGNDLPTAFAWDGTHWNREHADNPGGWRGSELNSVSCYRSTCVAAGIAFPVEQSRPVGELLTKNTYGGEPPAYMFTHTRLPQPGPGSALLNGISCSSVKLCRAVGGYFDRKAQRWRILVEAWADGSWHLNSRKLCAGACASNVPDSQYRTNVMEAISCTADTDCLAVGKADDRHQFPRVSADGIYLSRASMANWDLTPFAKP